ncbi:MAG: hypothetical protein J0I41_09500 [Filimonas sp.]|nr:hypothetical protein [Filimonas sp.]
MKKVVLSVLIIVALAACNNGKVEDVLADSVLKRRVPDSSVILQPAVNNPDSAVKMVDSAKKMIDKADVKVSISLDSVDKK